MTPRSPLVDAQTPSPSHIAARPAPATARMDGKLREPEGSQAECSIGCVYWLGARTAVIFAVATALPCAMQSARAESQPILIGESIHVEDGTTLDHVTCVACSIRVDGEVKDGATVVFGSLVNHGMIHGDAIVLGGSIESEGQIGGNAVIVLGAMRLLDRVGRDAFTVMGTIEMDGPRAMVAGNLVSVLGSPSNVRPNSVSGQIQEYGARQIGLLAMSGVLGASILAALGIFGILMALTGLGYITLGLRRLETIANAFTGNIVACFLIGLGTCAALIVTFLVAAMLVPVAIPLLLLFVVLSAVGYCGVIFGIGRNLFGGLKPFLATMFAAAVTIVIQMVPLVGWLTLLVIWNVAVGAAIMSGFGKTADWLAMRAEGGSWQDRQPA